MIPLDGITFTAHARMRWRERFAHLDFRTEVLRLRVIPAEERLRLARRMPRFRHLMGHSFRGYYYLVTPSGAILVMAPGRRVVTCFPVREEDGIHTKAPLALKRLLPQPAFVPPPGYVPGQLLA